MASISISEHYSKTAAPARLKKAPIAIEAVKRIDALFDIERAINGFSADERRRVRNEQSRPLLVELQTWLRRQRARLSAKSETAKAIDYALKRLTHLLQFPNFLSG